MKLSANRSRSDERLGTEPIGRLMLEMGLPMLLAQLINLLYNVVDRVYIGHIEGIGATALTGIGLTTPILQLISAFAALVGSSGAPLAAIALGKGDKDEARRIMNSACGTLLCVSFALTCLFLAFRRPFLYAVGASDATYAYANEYIVVYLIGTVFVQLTLGLNPYITCQGASRVAMLSNLIGAALNLVLDPLFIFAFGMGVRGAAIATVLSQAASAAWIVRFLSQKDLPLHFEKAYLRPRWSIMKHVLALGISPFTMQSTESLISVVLLSGLKQFGGDLYVGSLTIMQSVMQLISIPQGGFTQGCSPVISYNYGAGNMTRVWKTFRRLVAITTGYSGSIALAAMLFPRFFAGLFTDDAELIALVGRVLPTFIAGMLVFGAQSACQTTFMALGQAKRSLIVAMMRKVVLLAPLAYILPRITGDVMSIYRAEPIADFTSVAICLTIFLTFARKLNREKGIQ